MNNLHLWEPRRTSCSTVQYLKVWICSQNRHFFLKSHTWGQKLALFLRDALCQSREFKRISGPGPCCVLAGPSYWRFGQTWHQLVISTMIFHFKTPTPNWAIGHCHSESRRSNSKVIISSQQQHCPQTEVYFHVSSKSRYFKKYFKFSLLYLALYLLVSDYFSWVR